MNNALAHIEEEDPKTDSLELREGELVKVIESIEALARSEEYRTLKERVLDGVIAGYRNRLFAEAKKTPLNQEAIYKLQGQLAATSYLDFEKLAATYRLQLTSVRKQLNPPTERDIAQDIYER